MESVNRYSSITLHNFVISVCCEALYMVCTVSGGLCADCDEFCDRCGPVLSLSVRQPNLEVEGLQQDELVAGF